MQFSVPLAISGAVLASILLSWIFASLLSRVLCHRLMREQNSNAKRIGKAIQLGGTGIYLTMVCTISALAYSELKPFSLSPGTLKTLAPLLLAVSMIYIVGVLDDFFKLRPRTKFLLEMSISTFFILFDTDLLRSHESLPFAMKAISIGSKVLWLVAITNSYNMLDGINGLCSGLAGTTGLILGTILIGQGGTSASLGLIALLFSGACLGFFFINFKKGTVFLGDSGSLLIGFSIGALCLKYSTQDQTFSYSLAMQMIALVSLPLVDMIFVILLRLQNNHSIFKGDRRHIHDRLPSFGLSQKQTTLTLITFSLLINLLLGLAPTKSFYFPILLTTCTVMFIYFTCLGIKTDNLLQGKDLPHDFTFIYDLMTFRRVIMIHLMTSLGETSQLSKESTNHKIAWLLPKIKSLLTGSDLFLSLGDSNIYIELSLRGKDQTKIDSLQTSILRLIALYQVKNTHSPNHADLPLGITIFSLPNEYQQLVKYLNDNPNVMNFHPSTLKTIKHGQSAS